MTLGELIEAIGPLNNRYRETDGIERIDALWEIGELLENAANGPLDRLLWDIQQRSFITRDLLRYASIVRRGWPDKASLRSQFERVTSYSLFREALPFLKGDREGIDATTYKQVVSLISSADSTAARSFLHELKQKHIDRHHRKGASRDKMDEHIQAFKANIEQLERGLTEEPAATAVTIRSVYGECLNLMAKVLYAMATGAAVPPDVLPSFSSSVPDPLVTSVVAAAGGTREERSAFVKGVTTNLLMELADLFLALRTDISYTQWQKRPHISLQIGGKPFES